MEELLEIIKIQQKMINRLFAYIPDKGFYPDKYKSFVDMQNEFNDKLKNFVSVNNCVSSSLPDCEECKGCVVKSVCGTHLELSVLPLNEKYKYCSKCEYYSPQTAL